MEDTLPEDNIDFPDENAGKAANDAGWKNPHIPTGGEVFLTKDVRVLYQERLPHLDKGPFKAYRAVGGNKVVSDYFALICDKSMTPRRIAGAKYSKIINVGLVKLMASGKIIWPEAKEERLCFVYENTLGTPLLEKNKTHPALGWKPEIVLDNIVFPLISVLMDMRNKDLVHGEIWPGNIFFSGARTSGIQNRVQLGECLAAPPSALLPALYEPVERALADPIARGPGTFADDLYAFGVSLAVILRSTDPTHGLSDEEIIERKIEKGSYTTVIGKDRLSGALLELMRGLLYDDPVQRWTLDDVQAWMDGRRLSPKQSSKRVKATRPIIIHNKKYIRPELLAKDAYKHADEISKIVENGDLEQWIDRAIEDKVVKTKVESLLKEIPSYDRGSGYNERLAVAISTTLYTECPIRYHNLSFIPAGFGKALTYAYVMKHNLQPYVEILRHNFVIPAIRARKATDSSSLIAKFDSCRTFIAQKSMAAGLERCIYLMDGECPCLSPIIAKYYVQTPEEMMDAFEGLCSSSKPQILFDRHIISFLSIKDRKNIDPYITDLNSEISQRRILGQIRTLATIQKRSRLGSFPAITGWIADNIEDLYDSFHDNKKKEELKKLVDALKSNGDISKIAYLFDDTKIYQNDLHQFYQAMEEYRRIEHEKEMIEEKLKSKKDYGQRTGRQISSVISMLLSTAIILITAYISLLKG